MDKQPYIPSDQICIYVYIYVFMIRESLSIGCSPCCLFSSVKRYLIMYICSLVVCISWDSLLVAPDFNWVEPLPYNYALFAVVLLSWLPEPSLWCMCIQLDSSVQLGKWDGGAKEWYQSRCQRLHTCGGWQNKLIRCTDMLKWKIYNSFCMVVWMCTCCSALDCFDV